MSTVDADALVADDVEASLVSKRRWWAIPGLRATGLVGHACAGVLAVAVLVAIIGPWIAPHDPDATNLQFAYVGRYEDHYLGFDGQGRDILSRLLVGARTSLLGPLIVVVLLTAGVGPRWVWTIIQTCLLLGSIFFATGLLGEQIAVTRAEQRELRRLLDEVHPDRRGR